MTLEHPTSHYLVAYANGSLSDGMSLLVASHLTYCPQCRRDVEKYEAIVGGLFEAEPANGLSVPDRDAVMAKLDLEDEAPVREIALDQNSPLPAPIRAVAKGDVDALGWKFRMPGLSEYALNSFEGETVSLLRVKPGTAMLAHTHDAEEATLILSGQMQDGDKIYRKGDVALADHHDDHRPKVIGDEVCYCLIVMSGSVKFTGRVGRALNLFT